MTLSDSVFNSHTTTTDTDVNQRARLLTQAHKRLSELPAAILELGSIFARNGHELAMVGGPVRDALLGLPIHDYDFTTSARPDETERLLASWGGAHWDIGRDFGTIGASRDGLVVEVTTYRTEEYDAGSRKPGVHYGDSLEGDVTRRDFTVNAMAVRLPSLELADTTGGLDDLIAGVLRTPVSARQSFDDDPLRIMRAARFAAQLGFTVADDVRAAMSDMASRLEIVSVERIQAELHRLIISPFPRQGLELLVQTGVADVVFPELANLRDTVDEHGRHKDVYTHTLTVLDQAMALETDEEGPVPAPDFILRFAAIMHDIGKPATRRYEPDGTVTFHAHDIVGARMAAKRMKALRFDKATTKAVARLVELHLRFHGYGEQRWSDSAVRRYVTDAGDQLERLNRLTRADVTTGNKRKARWLAAGMDDLEQRIAELKEREEVDAIRPDLNGQQIMELLGLKPGPEVGQAYHFLLELRMEEGPLGPQEATKRLLAWWEDTNIEGK
ncbi:CCA tRNA nucleotidyltransferase [Arcanobacterium buesumense]|uniref:CCA tRNA nucleotidyltransferase n=1 Tax=Arcanobacterium buesumense TaxID=2722751 RepID=A0A6H2ENF2_9ACTO|nr:CCA tRNA nucleotidyltransferase [Arcanobacterium buesumense]QJC22601.1 CCA tRNA nucleotidyltransferase [Arcanobacterium buesumense]